MNTHGGDLGSSSDSCAGTKLMDERMWEFISLEITRGILEQTPVIFGTVKEGIMEILDQHIGALHTEVIAIFGSCTLSFRKFHARGAPKFFGEKDPIASRIW